MEAERQALPGKGRCENAYPASSTYVLKLKRETEMLATSTREELESRRNKQALIHFVSGPWKIRTNKTNIYMVEL